jgi:hypothetical protein
MSGLPICGEPLTARTTAIIFGCLEIPGRAIALQIALRRRRAAAERGKREYWPDDFGDREQH